jgi:tol-pal system protein YbgF
MAVVLVCLALSSAAPRAQSRQDQQLLADLRMLYEQVQQLRLAVSALAEQTKATNARLDSQVEVARKNHADETALVTALQASLDGLSERVNQNATQVGRLSTELPAIRQGLSMLTQLASQTLAQLTVPPPTATVDAGAPPATPPVANLPPSPASYWNQATGYYAIGQYESAIAAFQDFLVKFPESPDAAGAQFYIGESYAWLRKWPDALAAYTALVANPAYKTSEKVPDAYVRQGRCYEEMNRKADAIKAYQLVVKQYPGTNAELQATQNLKALGVIRHAPQAIIPKDRTWAA